jgi:hypothetical protein
MATVIKEIFTRAPAALAWDAIRDVGALHTRLVPGFVTHTELHGDVRTVTFANGMVVREPIVSLDEGLRRLVWSAEGGRTTHYNSSVQVFEAGSGRTRIVWLADFLPNQLLPGIEAAMSAGAEAMTRTLDKLA